MPDRDINLEKEYRRISYILGEVCDYPDCIEVGECDYSHENQPTCLHCLMSDALHLIEEQHKLLKELEVVEPVPDYHVRYWKCPKCNWFLTPMYDDGCDLPVKRDKFCASCGRKVKWNA